jgi:small subunit ribosomal protein S1
MSANDDFNWDEFESQKFGGSYSKSERAELEQMYGDTLTTVQEEEVIKGTVVGITERDVILNIGFKSDGLVPLSEFRDMPNLKVGDEVQVFIENQEDAGGPINSFQKKG